MTMLAVAAPALKVLFERIGRPEVLDRPDALGRFGGGAVIACNHVGWADSLWLAYAVYPRPLRFLSKRELFASPITSWALGQGGSIPIDRGMPSPSSIKTAVDAVRNGEIILIFPSGTRSAESTAFKRGAATIALAARVPLIPAYYQGPKSMQMAHLMARPRIQIRFAPAIATTGLPQGRESASALTRQLHAEIVRLQGCALEPRAA